jgi:phosphoribosylanthranilate isomerase
MTKVKICGLRRPEDVAAVNRARPDYAGFVFAPSRRRIDRETAASLKAGLATGIQVVGVFVNEEPTTIAKLYRERIIDLVQLHGDEDSGYIRKLKEACGCPVIKAVPVGNVLPVLPEGADYLLFDTASAQRGGSGVRFDLRILQDYNGPPYFLAGGLAPETVREAVGLLAPFGVDVSSGVETDGCKDEEKIKKFVRLVRGNQ